MLNFESFLSHLQSETTPAICDSHKIFKLSENQGKCNFGLEVSNNFSQKSKQKKKRKEKLIKKEKMIIIRNKKKMNRNYEKMEPN